MSDQIVKKAKRLLTDLKVHLNHVSNSEGLLDVSATVQGDTGRHDVRKVRDDWLHAGEAPWTCSCAARVNPCSHITAVAMVTGTGELTKFAPVEGAPMVADNSWQTVPGKAGYVYDMKEL